MMESDAGGNKGPERHCEPGDALRPERTKEFASPDAGAPHKSRESGQPISQERVDEIMGKAKLAQEAANAGFDAFSESLRGIEDLETRWMAVVAGSVLFEEWCDRCTDQVAKNMRALWMSSAWLRAVRTAAPCALCGSDTPDCPTCRKPMAHHRRDGAPYFWCSRTDDCAEPGAYRVCDGCEELRELEQMADAKLCKECHQQAIVNALAEAAYREMEP